MPPTRALQPQFGDGDPQRWRVSLTEDAFDSFVGGGGDGARVVFGEGSLFSPLLFGKFFDPADAFPLWEFEPEVLLSKAGVEWVETDTEFVLRAELPAGARKCEIEISGEKGKVIEISGQWRGRGESHARDWRTGRWWEHGYVRRLDLPESANWMNVEAYINDDISLEIKIPKKSMEPKASESV